MGKSKIHVDDPTPGWCWRTACGKSKNKPEYHIPLWLYYTMSIEDIVAECCVVCTKNILYHDLVKQAVEGAPGPIGEETNGSPSARKASYR